LAELVEPVLLDPVVLDDPHFLADRLATNVEEEVAACMTKAGYRYRPAPQVGSGGPTPESQANADEYLLLLPPEQRRYDATHGRCNRKAYEAVVVPAGEALRQLMPRMRVEISRIYEHPSLRAPLEKWVACMASKGITATPAEAASLDQQDQAFLTARRACSTTTGVEVAATAVARGRWRDFASRNYELLVAMTGGS
jgi:hypothetical protein